MTQNYRKLALVAPSLPPLDEQDDWMCPACGETNYIVDDTTYGAVKPVRGGCHGGRWGFLWLRVCRELRAHVHYKCRHCGARWIAAPDRAAYFEAP